MLILVITCFGWWGDVIKESRKGDHTPVVDIGLRYGMILFIASEVMFFVAWFWMFFELAIDPARPTRRLDRADVGCRDDRRFGRIGRRRTSKRSTRSICR